MKKLLTLLLACTIAAAGTYTSGSAANLCPGQRTKTIKGSGRLVVRTTEVPPFHEVEASRGVQVILTDGEPGSATISADDNLLEYVSVRSAGERLVIGLDPKLVSVSNPHITVTLPTDGRIRLLEASSGAGIEAQRVLTASELKLHASSAACLRVETEAKRCEAEASSGAGIEARLRSEEGCAHVTSGARIDFSGTADRCKAEASSGGHFDGRNLTTSQCNVRASSGANASVHCTDQIDAHASSGGHITYTGSCTGSTTASSGGSIRKR